VTSGPLPYAGAGRRLPRSSARALTFHPAPSPGDEDVAQVLATVRARVGRLLARRQLEPEDDSALPDPLSETSPVLAGLVSASVQSRVALGPRAGARVRRVGDEPELDHVSSRGPRQAQLDGFDLHASPSLDAAPPPAAPPPPAPPPHPSARFLTARP